MSVLAVPDAPMLVVPLLLAVVSVEVVLDVLGAALVLAEPLTVPEPEAPMVLELFLLASVLPVLVAEALVPPGLPDAPDVPLPDCANAMPPTARAAAAASVVNVFIMSCSLNG